GTSGTFSNTATGVVDFQGDGISIYGGGSGADSFTNAGAFKKSSGTGTSYVNGNTAFSSSGTVLVQAGTLEFGGSITNTKRSSGAVSVSAGATLNLGQGGSSAASAFSVAGTVNFSGGTFTVGAGSYNALGTTFVSGGVADFSAATITSFGTLSLTGGTLKLGA